MADDILITDVAFSDTHLITSFDDGRRIETPLAWFPRLHNAAPAQRANWRFIGRGYGVHWPDVDEDLSAEGLLKGLKSFDYRGG